MSSWRQRGTSLSRGAGADATGVATCWMRGHSTRRRPPSMPPRDIIVVGASLGGVEALPKLAAGLPANLRAAVLIVLHIPQTYRGYLAAQLNKSGPLRAAP